MNLLFVTAESFPTHRADISVLFGKYLPRHRVFSDLVAERASEHAAAMQWGGGAAILCTGQGGRAVQHIRKLVHNLWQLARFRTARYQAVQVRDLPITAVFALLFARLKGRPFFYWMSFPIPESCLDRARARGPVAGMRYWFPLLRGHLGKWTLERLVLPRADHIFVQTQAMLDALAARGVPRARMTPVPMGVDLDATRADLVPTSDDPRLDGKRVLVYLGTLDRARHIERLFEMLAIVLERVPNALLVLVGDTEDEPFRAWLEQRAMEIGVSEHVLWTGWLPTAQGWSYVRRADVGLSPIPRGPLLDVGSPTKTIEYLALGVPVVGNDNPDQAWLIRESGGGRCVPYTPADFADAVAELLALAPDARAAMAEMGRRFVSAHRDYAALAAMLAMRYRELLAHKGADDVASRAAGEQGGRG